MSGQDAGVRERTGVRGARRAGAGAPWLRQHGVALVVLVLLVVGLLAEGLVLAWRAGRLDGSAQPTATASVGSSPLAQETLCEVFSARELERVLEMRVYSVSYSHQPQGVLPGGGQGYSYSCRLESDQDPLGRLSLDYSASTRVVRAGSDTVEFDDIPQVYLNARVEELELEGVEGQGWAWNLGRVTALVAWRYPDGHTALARLSCWDGCSWGPGPGEDDYELGFRTVLAGALARLPQVASGPARSGSLPAGPGSASPSASSSASP
ncbi:hypothetical protein [Actinomyces wuliandei]|uniref:hypothetical protein n=1 Tax=Actinomyces wuliandei TaxID=2057743 RepID=UPI000FD920DB|nr:hypothetical protein [Actinomyces wuliandei]